MRKLLFLGLIAILAPVDASGYLGRCLEPEGNLRLLVVDYAMAYPEEHTELIRVLSEAGFDVDYRPWYPALVERDAETYDVIVLMGGGDPGMSVEEVDLAVNFVWRGKVLILAVPSDGPYGDRRKANAGVHDRYQFNEVLSRLNIGLFALNADLESNPVLDPVLPFEVYDIAWGWDEYGTVTGRSGTRLVVGEGGQTMPILLAPAQIEPSEEASLEEEPGVRIVRRTIEIPPTDAIAGEDIVLLLRIATKLRANIYYRDREQPEPEEWERGSIGGRVEEVSEATSTLTVRVHYTHRGAEYALVTVPIPVIGAAFASREIREEPPSATHIESIHDNVEPYGRTVVAAIGDSFTRAATGYNSDIGFVAAVDRDLLSGLDRPVPPLGMGPPVSGNESLERFLAGLALYTRELRKCPIFWDRLAMFPRRTQEMPGNPKPRFTLNDISILPALPERVRVVDEALPPRVNADTMLHTVFYWEMGLLGEFGTDRGADVNAASQSDTDATPVADPSTITKNDVPLRGVWDFIVRRHEHAVDLAGALPGLGMDFLWTVAPAASYTGGASISRDLRFETWATPILNRLNGTPTAWYAGVSVPREGEISGDFVEALDARGEAVGLPSRLDMNYLNQYLFEPARIIALHSRGQPALKAIVHDWETHIARSSEPYAATDVFDHLHFRYFISHLTRNGLDYGDEYKTVMELDRNERFEWLLKSGYLETYIQLQESIAERLGTRYRRSMDEINPGLRHGAFVRSLRPNWFHLGFWRGAGTPERPFLIFSYERPPAWYADFLRDKGISARVIPVGLLGLVGDDDPDNLLQAASEQGGYALERGLWLFADPPEEAGLNALPEDVNRDTLLEAIRKADGE